MFQPRLIQTSADWVDDEGVKLYTISAAHQPVDIEPYLARLGRVKKSLGLDWANTPAFAICHDGAGMQYLVLCYWGNDNELFTRVSVNLGGAWVEDPATYAFCLWDMEVMWAERTIFIDTLYSGNPDLAAYRARRPEAWLVAQG